MLNAVPQLVASILLVVVSSIYRTTWQSSTIGQVYALIIFVAIQTGSVILVFLSTNTSLAATTTIAVACSFAAALFAKPVWHYIRRRRQKKMQTFRKSDTGKF